MKKYTLKEQIKDNFYLRWIQHQIKYVIPAKVLGDRRIIEKKYLERMGYRPDLDHPKRLNEKLQWLKLHDRRPFCTMCADKYRVREYLKKNFGCYLKIFLFFAIASICVELGAKMVGADTTLQIMGVDILGANISVKGIPILLTNLIGVFMMFQSTALINEVID